MRAFSSSFQLCILLILIFQSIEKSCGDFDVIVGVVQALNGSESVAAQVASEILVGTRMAIDKINRENWINGSISILEQDTGTQRVSAIQAGLNLLDPLRTSVKVMLMVGAQTSSTAQLISPYGEIFHTPLFSYWASADDLSSSSRFPYFHRKFPSNLEEATAIIQLISHYKWTTLGVIFSDGDDFSASLANFINQLY